MIMKTLHTIYTNFAKRFAVVLTLLTFGLTSAWAATETATLDFTKANNCTSIDENKQIWTENGITLTNDKHNSATSVTNYTPADDDPIRCYKNSKITITHTSNKIAKIVFNCSESKYNISIGDSEKYEVNANGNTTTVTFKEPVASYEQVLSSGQVRLNSIEVTYESAPSTFTVTCKVNEETPWGTLSSTDPISDLASGTSISAEGYVLTIDETEITATPNEADAQYTYAFKEWTWEPAGATITSDVVATATFTRTERRLTNFRTLCTYDIVLKNNYKEDDSKDGFATITSTYTKLSISPAPSAREGYMIEGYYLEPECTNKVADDQGNLVDNVTNYTDADGKWIGGETTLYTKWIGREYTVTLDDNGGSGGSGTITATYGSPMPAITLPTRTGYTFNGYWTGKTTQSTQYYDANGNSLKNWDKAGNTTTLYALWTANTNTLYVVKHYKELLLDGTYPTEADDTDNLTGTTAASVTPAVKSYEGFTAPSTQTVSIAADGSTVVIYKYTRNSYKLTWDLAGGIITTEGTAEGSVKYEAPITAPTVAKTGYNFISWSPEVPATMPADNVTCTAQWTANTYTITLDQQEATTQGITTVEATYGSALPSIAENLPSKTGYDFGGYFTEPNGNGTQYYHGTGNGARNWNIASETTLYAYWKPNTCTLIFNMNGGVGEQPNLTATYDQPMPALTAPLPTLSGYEFSGYFDEKTGGVMYYNAAGESARNWDKTNGEKTLYAQWAAIHTITWLVNGSQAEGDPTTSVVNGQTITTLPTTPDVDCNGKVFVGWTTSTIHGEIATIPDPLYTELGNFPAVTSNMTFYAVFADGEGDEHWVETEINDIEATDEVVVMMAHGTDLYALPYDKETASNSNPAATPIMLDDFERKIVDELIWYIEKDHESNNFTLSPKTATDKYLTCNKSSNAVRINTGENRNFTIENDFLKNTAYSTFLAISTATPKDWRHYGSDNETISSKVQTLKFYKKTTVYTSYTNYSTSCMAGVCDITNANPIYVTSAVGQKIKATDKLVLTTTDMAVGTEISLSAPNITFYKEGVEITQLTTTADSETFELEIAYQPTNANTTEQPTITLEILGYQFAFENKVTGRSLPETFAIVAKVGNIWYALPSQGLNSETTPVGYPVEVDNNDNPTAVTAVPANADWSLRQVYASSGSNDRFAANGKNLVFVNADNKTLYASKDNANIQTYAEYTNYAAINPGLYEWTPTTTDLETYTLTNAQRTDRTLNVATNTVFGVHSDNKATTEVRFLPITGRYTPAALQVVEWKEISVVIMYNGDPAQDVSVSSNFSNTTSPTETLSSLQKDIAIYELPTTNNVNNATQALCINIGTEKTILSIPYIINSETTDADVLPGSTVAARQEVAKVSDLVILKGATLTAAGSKGNPYKFRNVTVYGGGKLVIPSEEKGFGVASLTLRAGGITDAGEYDYVYPQFDLRGTFTNSAAKINLDYLTTKEQYYTFVAPFDVNTKDIKYPVDIYGSNVAANNTGSYEFQYYDGAARAEGNPGWKVVEEGETGAILTAGQGYTFLGMPKKVSVNGGTSTRQKFGIHRIPMSVTAADAMTHETNDQTAPLSVHLCDKNNNSGWNLIGNPYMTTITGLTNNDIQVGKLVHTTDANGNWTGGWHWDDPTTGQRFLVFPSDDGQSYEAVQASNATLPAFKNFFVQIGNENADALSIPRTTPASPLQAPAHHAEEVVKDLELAIVLEQDEEHTDQMDLLINNIYSANFDRDADFTKMMNATNLNLYGVHPYDNLSFVAMDHYTAEQSVKIGYQVPQAGEYTLRMSEKLYVMFDKIEALYVTDHEMSPEVTTDIISEPYRFTVKNAETNNERFTISLKLKSENQGPTTGWENIDVGQDQSIKFIHQDRLYILRNGIIYDATGQPIHTINK